MIDQTRYKAWRSGPDPELHVDITAKGSIRGSSVDAMGDGTMTSGPA